MAKAVREPPRMTYNQAVDKLVMATEVIVKRLISLEKAVASLQKKETK